MKKKYLIFISLAFCAISCRTVQEEEEIIRWLATPAPGEVLIRDSFWSPKIELNRVKTIPYVFMQCEQTGRIDNFAIAGGLKKGSHTGARYNDSDVFKIIEGACYSLMETPDPALRSYLDLSLIHI